MTAVPVPANARVLRRARFAPRVTLRGLRLATGLVLFAYVTMHLANHALGNVSLGAMEAGLDWAAWFWRLPPTGSLLYGALSLHAVLALYALYARPRLGWRPAELMQLAFGFAIVPLLVHHVVGTRLAYTLYGWRTEYPPILYYLWVTSPREGAMQAVALVLAWAHGCLGLYFWLRLKVGFARAAPALAVAAAIVPVLALLGYVQAGRAVMALAADESWRAEYVPGPPVPVPGRPDPAAVLDRFAMGIVLVSLVLVAGAFAARLVRHLVGVSRGLVRLTYPDGAVVRVPRGTSVLEASRLGGVPHASVCGGRGRCSTCRVRISDGAPGSPGEAEQAVLDRVGAGPGVRLACQVRPHGDIAVAPLFGTGITVAKLRDVNATAFGEERFIVAMFVDMRGSTRLAERRLPYDTVFIINRFLNTIAAGVAAAGGSPNQFLGDGMMALFGLRGDRETAARQALAALGLIASGVAALNRSLDGSLDEPIRFGIGLHAGTAILGHLGDREGGRAVFTAIGDPINVASRLQGLTKRLGVEALVSDAVFEAAGFAPDLPREEVGIDGRDGQLWVRKLAEAGQRWRADAASGRAETGLPSR